ncbi:hypothetical protein TIFTF001_022761 [Ficus carica]|uniref:Uncharacterized protein n=1 Tax=Ficus carica TaxID=3494 RepID=A0AA88AIF0_FICCA|nr:hypothetical protein TIFTF001_022761 [Ficus carica]
MSCQSREPIDELRKKEEIGTKEKKEGQKQSLPIFHGVEELGKSLRENLSPKQKGDWKDVTLMSLSFAVYVYISQQMVCAYFAWMSIPRQQCKRNSLAIALSSGTRFSYRSPPASDKQPCLVLLANATPSQLLCPQAQDSLIDLLLLLINSLVLFCQRTQLPRNCFVLRHKFTTVGVVVGGGGGGADDGREREGEGERLLEGWGAF